METTATIKVLFVGLGSIGCRHIKNLKTICDKANITCEIDALRHNDRPLQKEIENLINKQIFDIEKVCDYDIAFITNPTNLHFDIIQKISNRINTFFIEKPIFDNAELSLENAGLQNKKAYIAAPMRFCETFIKLKEIISQYDVYSARVICSSYLPEWRKDVDYRNVYSAKKEMGGGVTIDLIHEWDYVVDLFGMPLESLHFKGQYSNLEITSDDLSIYIARYNNMLLEIHLDYIGFGYRRSIELLTNKGNLIADFGNGNITLPNGEKIDCQEDVNQRYLREMQYFLQYALDCKAEQSINSPQKALQVLNLSLNNN